MLKGMNGNDQLFARDLVSDTTIDCDGGSARAARTRPTSTCSPRIPTPRSRAARPRRGTEDEATRSLVGGGRRDPAMASLAVIGVLAVAGAGRRRPGLVEEARARPRTPNVVVIETDDQTVESMRVMGNVNSLIGDQGATFANSFVNYSLCCPSRATFLTGQYAHNHGVLGNKPPNGGFGRFQALHGDNNLAVWLQDAGYYTAMIGKYLNGYANNPLVPPGWSEWYAAAAGRPGGLRLHAERERHAGQLRPRPRRLQAGRADRKGGRLRRPPGAEAQPFFLWLTYTAPHAGGPDPNPNPPFNCRGAREAGAAPRPRVRLRAAAEAPELQRGGRLRQAGRDPEPPAA